MCASGLPADDGTIDVELRGHNVRSLAGELAGFGGAVEILDPPEVRDELARDRQRVA